MPGGGSRSPKASGNRRSIRCYVSKEQVLGVDKKGAGADAGAGVVVLEQIQSRSQSSTTKNKGNLISGNR